MLSLPARGLVLVLVAFALLLPSNAVGDEKSDAKEAKKLGKKLGRAVAQGDDHAASTILEQLADQGSREAVVILVATAASDSSVTVFEKAFTLLTEMDAERLDSAFGSLLQAKKPDSLHLAVVVMVAEKVEGEIAEGWMIEALNSADEMARRNAILALDRRRSKTAIPLLIDMLDKKQSRHGTLEYMARIALISLTGHDFELVEDWRKFWETHGESLDPENLGDEDAATGVELKKADQDVPEFFGVKIVSRKVVFVIDVSGSMALWDDNGTRDWQARQRIFRVKQELANAVRRLKKNGYFNILSFSHQVQTFKKKMVPASGGNKGGAMKFIRKLNAKGGTLTDDALQAAFKDPNADTIVLLSDGSPARGKQEGPEVMIPRIIEDVRRMNRLKKIRIFTFGFEGKGQFPPGDPRQLVHEHKPEEMIRFLKTLAEENGGKYTTIK